MRTTSPQNIREILDTVYRAESRKILATLIRILGDFDRAEEALHDAFAAALETWPRDGVPANPMSWLISAGKFRGIDSIRRQSRFDSSQNDLIGQLRADEDPSQLADNVVKDNELRLIFTCCHPALSPDARIALTLREVCGLTTEEIARAFLTTPPTVAQRIVRAKAKIREAHIPYQLPEKNDLPERLQTVLHVIYLVFSEGYSASSGSSVTRPDLSGEAIRLARRVVDLLSAEPVSGWPDPEVLGLLALMLLQESRRDARTSPAGDLVLLEEQDRSLWDRNQIEEGIALVNHAMSLKDFGMYTLQAAISAVHAGSPDPASTDWTRIVRLYDLLLGIHPSPVVELNRAVAVAMVSGPEEGLRIIDALLERGDLADYRFAHSARAELLRRAGRTEEARDSFRRALDLTEQEPERRFLTRKLKELQ